MPSARKNIIGLLTSVLLITMGSASYGQESDYISIKPLNTSLFDFPAEYNNNIELPKTILEVSTIVRGDSVEDKIVNSKTAGLMIPVYGEKHISHYLSAKMGLFFFLMTGTYTNRYTTEGSAPSIVAMSAAFVDFHPFNWTTTEVGVIPIEFSSLLSSFFPLGFPGAKETLHTKGDYLEGSVSGSKTIPTASSPEVKSSEDGVNTTLDVYGVAAGTNALDKEDLTLKVTGSHFQFNNLTSSAATDSQYYGNSVTVVGTGSRFKYDFAGNEVAGLAEYKFTKRFKFGLKGSQLVNDKAPDGQNKANQIKGTVTYKLTGVELIMDVAGFRYESDSLPASYTNILYGNSNRFGYSVLLSSEWTKSKTRLFGKFVQANVINENIIYQADRQIFTLGLETKYDVF